MSRCKVELNELRGEEEEKHRKWWNKRIEFIRKWSDLGTKLDGYVTHITQDDGDEKWRWGKSITLIFILEIRPLPPLKYS